MQQLRQACGDSKKQYDVSLSLKPAVDLLHEMFQRLELKGKAFEVYDAASMKNSGLLLLIDSTLTTDDTTKEQIKKKADVCCMARHYSFQIKKCGVPSCEICKPVRMDRDVRNVGLLVQCEECNMWRLLFCRFKLNYQET